MSDTSKFDNVIILHGCPPNEQTVTQKENRWKNWLAKELADRGYDAIAPDFPHHLKSLEMYKQSLKPRVIKLENKFHFLYFQMKTNEFPELLEEITSS